LSGVGNTYSANAGGGTIAIEYPADALAAGTVIDAYVLSDTSTATSIIGAGNDYVMSLVLAWVHPTTGLVETTATGKPIKMTITNSAIKKGAKIYSVIGVIPTLLTTATTDGSAIILITDDPQIVIAITKPDAPTGVFATSGGNASTTVSWTAPSGGGSAITSYTVTSNAGQTCSSTTTTCTVTGLTNGTPYTFTVTATNSIGTSDPSSASSAATPAAPVVTLPNSGGGSGGSTYVAPTVVPTTVAATTTVTTEATSEEAATSGLPATGTNNNRLALIALLFVVAGSTLLVRRRVR
jgi:LPXTG-motif cell wall-anchored protein